MGKLYRVLCTAISGIHDKRLEKGKVYDETDFVPGHVEEHVKNGHVEEVIESALRQASATADRQDDKESGSAAEVKGAAAEKVKKDPPVK